MKQPSQSEPPAVPTFSRGQIAFSTLTMNPWDDSSDLPLGTASCYVLDGENVVGKIPAMAMTSGGNPLMSVQGEIPLRAINMLRPEIREKEETVKVYDIGELLAQALETEG